MYDGLQWAIDLADLARHVHLRLFFVVAWRQALAMAPYGRILWQEDCRDRDEIRIWRAVVKMF
jgi:hypothetical protein